MTSTPTPLRQRAGAATHELLKPSVSRYIKADDGERDMVLKTYRYLRLGMVIVMVALLASLFLVRRTTDHFEQSISAYYYTPAHSVFVGALVAVGVTLIAIKGWTALEEWSLNIAGMFAPVIAFVPTTPAGSNKLDVGALANANNNIGALLIAGWFTLVLVIVITAVDSKQERNAPRRKPGEGRRKEIRAWIGVAVLVVLLMTATALHWWWSRFPEYAHGWSAAAMFGALGIAALGNGWRPPVQQGWTFARVSYLVVGGVMLVVGVGYAVTSLTNWQWSYEILEVEFFEILLFVVFWGVQSIERWNWTVKPPTATVPS